MSVGDGGCDYAAPAAARRSTTPRATRTCCSARSCASRRRAAIPPDNPFQGADGALQRHGRNDARTRCQETYAWGLRNPFRIAFDPNAAGTRFYINDVGPEHVGGDRPRRTAGADYGWNVREGHCVNGSTTNCGAPPAGMTNPIFDYGRGDGCASITGGAFVPSGGLAARRTRGTYIFSDYVCGRIFQLVPNGSGGFNRVGVRRRPGRQQRRAPRLRAQRGGQGAVLHDLRRRRLGSTHRLTSPATARRSPT